MRLKNDEKPALHYLLRGTQHRAYFVGVMSVISDTYRTTELSEIFKAPFHASEKRKPVTNLLKRNTGIVILFSNLSFFLFTYYLSCLRSGPFTYDLTITPISASPQFPYFLMV